MSDTVTFNSIPIGLGIPANLAQSLRIFFIFLFLTLSITNIALAISSAFVSMEPTASFFRWWNREKNARNGFIRFRMASMLPCKDSITPRKNRDC